MRVTVAARRWALPLVVVLALATAGWAAGGGTGLGGGTLPPPRQEQTPPSASATTSSPVPEPSADAAERLLDAPTPAWLTWLVTGFFIGLIVLVVGVFLYVGVRYLLTERVIRREIVDQAASQPGDVDAEAEQVREAVRAGIADLDAGGDARRAVIACWLRLERIAAGAGAARLAADTPADLVARLLAGHRVREATLGRLADAYRLARYAPAEVGDELLVTARRALHDVAVQLGVTVPEPRP
jgi:Domain of unknown function (DUF4129)